MANIRKQGKIRKQDLLRELSNCVEESCVFLPTLSASSLDDNVKYLLIVYDEYEVDEVFFFDEEFRPVRDLIQIENNQKIYCFNNRSSDVLKAFLLSQLSCDYIRFLVQK